MKKICLNCTFGSPVLGLDKDLVCEIDDEFVTIDYSCDLFVAEHEFDPNPEYDECRDMPEECWLET